MLNAHMETVDHTQWKDEDALRDNGIPLNVISEPFPLTPELVTMSDR